MPLQDILRQLVTYLRGMWRYRWYTMAVAWVVAIAGWIFVMQLPDTFDSSARIHVDTDSMLRPLLRGLTVETNVSNKVSLMTKKLLSRPVLEKVARKADLDLKTGKSHSISDVVTHLSKKIKISATQRSNLYNISAESDNPRTARDIVQALVTVFMEDSLGDSRKGSVAAQEFLEKQIQEYEDKLREAEGRIKDFKQKYAGRMPGSGSGYYEKLQAATIQLDSAKLQLKEVENRRDELRRQMVGEEPIFGIMADDKHAEQHPLDGRISQMQSELNALMLQYTEQHPKIASIRETIAILEKQRAADLAQLPDRSRDKILDKNPVYQQIKIALGVAEAEASSLSVRVAEYQERVDKLNKLSNIVPEIEAKLKDLNRDYNLHKKNYETLISRLEAAKMSEKAEKTGDDVKFEVIEPPNLPVIPSGPNRVLLSSGALAIGIIVGVLVALLMSQLRPAFYDQRTLRLVTGLPVFGSVSRIWTPELLVKKRIEFGGFLSIGLLLVVTFTGVLVMNSSTSEWSNQVIDTVRSISK